LSSQQISPQFFKDHKRRSLNVCMDAVGQRGEAWSEEIVTQGGGGREMHHVKEAHNNLNTKKNIKKTKM
jgi:hypothetical protein